MALTYEPFLVILAGCAAAAVMEAISWALVYRTSSYMRLRGELDRAARKLEALKSSDGGAARPHRKEKRLEDLMRTGARDLTATRMKLGAISMAGMFVMYQLVSKAWDGVVVARLPFHPPGFIAAVTHRGVAGDDMTECGAAFVYAMSLAYAKAVIDKAAGWSPSRATNRLMQAASTMAMDPAKMK
ncbi:tmco1 [Scenedesmus sp. PABB004]|nr:tmco1 [Scenedesmus sp. PABB004]